MASPNSPKSSAELIREHSQARVLEASPPKVNGYLTNGDGTPLLTADGRLTPKFNRILTDHSVIENYLIKKLGSIMKKSK